MNWKPQVKVENEWGSNALVFATKDEADWYAHDLFCRWWMATDWRSVESTDPVNYSFVGGVLTRIEGA